MTSTNYQMKTIIRNIIFVVIFLGIALQLLAQKKESPDYIEAFYNIKVIDSTTHPYMDKDVPEYQINIIQVSGFMSVEVMKYRLERYINNPKTRKECDAMSHCPVLAGNSHLSKYENADFSKPSFEKKYPITVHTQRKNMGYKYDKKGNEIYTCTYISSSSGNNLLDRIVVEVKSFDAPFGILQPLNPSYVIWTEPTGGLHHATGIGKAYNWDDYECKLKPYNVPNSIDISSVKFAPDQNLSKNQTCEPLLILDYQSLDNFMLKGSNKKYTIETKGNYYSKDESYGGEFFRKIEIKLILNQPYIELAPLEPVVFNENGLPELAPLEPYNPELAPLEPLKPEEPFELAPLEPIKK